VREKLEGIAQTLAQRIGSATDEAGVHFFLILSSENPSWSTYVSNSEREGSVQLLRETASRLEHWSDVPPGVRGDDEPRLVRFSTRIEHRNRDRVRLQVFADSELVGVLRLKPEHAAAISELLYREQEVT
jgi:hypothetical protein